VGIDTHEKKYYFSLMKTIDAFDEQFPDEESCKQFLTEMRWPKGVACPRCGNKNVYALKARAFHWICKSKDCGGKNGYRFSVITHTIFQDTKKPLKLWFKVGYLMLVGKKGISALQIHRVIFGENSGSDYHTSWYMCMRWRTAMQGDYVAPLSDEVEVDETFVGGKEKNKHAFKRMDVGRGTAGKVAVIGAIARKGMVVAKVIENTDTRTLDSFVRSTVADDVSLVATDEHSGYRLLDKDYPHESVRHGQHEYVRGKVHTSSIDSFWSLLKRGIMGQFHHVSKGYLPLYVNEFSWRHNNRKNPNAFSDLLTTCGK
jgi:transposase-like protein